MKVSIIMPVYNAAPVMRRALDSISGQTFRDFELVCVDDCSTDGSAAILSEYAAGSDFPVKVLSHQHNQGAAAARNTALDAAEGEYLSFIDADDALTPEALEKAVGVLDRSGADIVGWDWYLSMTKNERLIRQADYASPLDGVRNFFSGVMRWNLWLFVSRRTLWVENGIRFIPGKNMGEDLMVMSKAFCCAGKVAQIHEPLYHYNAVNSSSISKQFSLSNRAQVSANVAEVERFVADTAYSSELKPCLAWLKLNIKLPLLVSGSKGDYRLWKGWYSEANPFVMSNKSLPLRTRLLQKAAALGLWPVVWFYWLLVEKVFYGVIYR